MTKLRRLCGWLAVVAGSAVVFAGNSVGQQRMSAAQTGLSRSTRPQQSVDQTDLIRVQARSAKARAAQTGSMRARFARASQTAAVQAGPAQAVRARSNLAEAGLAEDGSKGGIAKLDLTNSGLVKAALANPYPAQRGWGQTDLAQSDLAQAGLVRAAVGQAILVQPTLQLITRQAGYIFVGKVIAVKQVQAANPDEVASMRVTFRVEQALRGVRAGTDFVLSEWAGLWNGGERYRLGSRILLFLYPKSRLGLTSPVAGRQGRFDVDRTGDVEIDAGRRDMLGSQEIEQAPGPKIGLKELTRAIRRAARQEER